MMNKYLRFLLIGLLFFMLVLVRAFASELFYDPFIHYFKDDYLHKPIPETDLLKLYLSTMYRYILNALISVGIIYLLFQKKYLKFALQFYIIAFIVLILLYSLPLFGVSINQFSIFYIRRFLIHPIFVLLLIPAFYYQKKHA